MTTSVNSRSTLQRNFINGIAKIAAEETVQEYERIFASVQEFCATHSVNIQQITPNDVALFLRQEWTDYSIDTFHGKMSKLSNILAYVWKEDPVICIQIISKTLYEDLDSKIDITTAYTDMLTERERKSVEAYLNWIKNRKYGSRLHAIVELTVETHSRPSVVTQLDLSDLNFNTGTVTLAIPDTHIVSQAGLQTTRTAELPPTASDAVKTYCRHVRSTTVDETDAVFTTPSGRISQSTLYREVTQTSENVLQSLDDGLGLLMDSETETPLEQITPNLLRGYSLEQINA